MSMNPVCVYYQNQSLAFVKNAQLSPRSKYDTNKVLQIIKYLFRCIIILEYNIGYKKFFSFKVYVNSINVYYIDLLK